MQSVVGDSPKIDAESFTFGEAEPSVAENISKSLDEVVTAQKMDDVKSWIGNINTGEDEKLSEMELKNHLESVSSTSYSSLESMVGTEVTDLIRALDAAYNIQRSIN
ncbi:hypothetical protein ACW2QC_00925 [Virgibacillus sp. FSP13]